MRNGSPTLLPLVAPVQDYELEYRAYLREFHDAQEKDYLAKYDQVMNDFPSFVRHLRDQAQGTGLPPGWVPATTYWMLRSDRRLIGEASLRHRLTPALEDFGGHIGYAIRPSDRNKGYGTNLLRLMLRQAQQAGIHRVLITCDPANVSSVRVIEKNGGNLASQTIAHTGRMTARYWIDL
jgi:predicted acetyltransferase